MSCKHAGSNESEFCTECDGNDCACPSYVEALKPSHNKPIVVICQNIVEDMLNHLVREGLLTRSQCMSVRDTFVGIVVGKLTHVG